ncbi:MAG: hypothetical protein JWR75_1948 [Devosia sp.]|nr:hypothetical protein [Devosia sp.]
MSSLLRAVSLVPLLALAACGSTTSVTRPPIVGMANAGTVLPMPPQQQGMSVAETTAVAAAMIDVNAFVETTALPLMTARDKSEASNAQYYALQFGRPGAPRLWKGDSSANGSVQVGPIVRVNNLDCRDFTHAVSISGKAYNRKGTACRENGIWAVVSTAV